MCFLRNPSAMQDSIAHILPTFTICDKVQSKTVQEPLRTHTSVADRLWFVVYRQRLRQEWRVLFVWDPTRFLKKLWLGLYFTLGTVYSKLSCAIPWYHKRFRRPYAHVVALQIVCDLLCITDGSATIDVCFSDVDRTHSFSWTVCGEISRWKQKYSIWIGMKKQIWHNIQLNK